MKKLLALAYNRGTTLRTRNRITVRVHRRIRCASSGLVLARHTRTTTSIIAANCEACRMISHFLDNTDFLTLVLL